MGTTKAVANPLVITQEHPQGLLSPLTWLYYFRILYFYPFFYNYLQAPQRRDGAPWIVARSLFQQEKTTGKDAYLNGGLQDEVHDGFCASEGTTQEMR